MLPRAVAFDEEVCDGVLRVDRRKVGHGEHVAALVVRAFGLVGRAPLRVDEQRRTIGKGAGLRIAARLGTQRVDVDHPAAAAPRERRVDARRERGELRHAGRIEIFATIRPCRRETAVFVEHDAVVDDRGIVEEIRQTLCRGAKLAQV